MTTTGNCVTALILLLATFFALGASDACATEPIKWRGYLVDRSCADSVRQDPDPKSFLQHHTKDCALMPNCQSKGYSLYSDKKWFDLDKKGTQLAVKTLRASRKKSGFFVEITGTAKNNLLTVQEMKEVDEPKGDAQNGTD